VKALLSHNRVDPSANNNEAIRLASSNRNLKIVKLLLNDNRVDPCANNNEAIQCACKNGHTKIVKALLGDNRVDPSSNDNYALRLAFENSYIDILHLLLRQKKVQSSLKNTFLYLQKTIRYIQEDARKMIPYYSDAFYETYQLPDDIMHVILGEFTFGYTTKECAQLLKCI